MTHGLTEQSVCFFGMCSQAGAIIAAQSLPVVDLSNPVVTQDGTTLIVSLSPSKSSVVKNLAAEVAVAATQTPSVVGITSAKP